MLPGDNTVIVRQSNQSLEVFKVPDKPAPKKRKKVLDEDSYIDNMGKIIERDFFPDLGNLKVQTDYLDAVERSDLQKLQELGSKFGVDTPSARRFPPSPTTFETPVAKSREDDDPRNNNTNEDASNSDNTSAPNSDDEVSLDEYLSTHTSEDNQNFEDLAKEATLRVQAKMPWLYQLEELPQRERLDGLQVLSIEQQADPKPRPHNIDMWGYVNKNYIMYVPDGAKLTPQEIIEQVTKKRQIIHSNTRLHTNPFNEHQNKEMIQHLAQTQAHQCVGGKIGVDGKELSQSDTPSVNGFSFVRTPSPAPGVNESPVMTWGDIDATPLRLDGGSTPVRAVQGPSFRIAEPPKREKLAMALAGKASERHRDRKMKALEAARKQLGTPSPGPRSAASMDRLNSMSPAARRLLHRLGSDYSLQASSGSTPTPKQLHPSTPKSIRSKMCDFRKRAPTPNLNITDNLLNLPSVPRRPKASDFF
uniref:Splicing factor ESS-2 homolog n=1 Tax=Timema bartmani TaxID=61472 RepID=A0A7R9EQP5_9NEOP|nr:unnamed protein product [Timema bartmani]